MGCHALFQRPCRDRKPTNGLIISAEHEETVAVACVGVLLIRGGTRILLYIWSGTILLVAVPERPVVFKCLLATTSVEDVYAAFNPLTSLLVCVCI